MLKKTEYPLSEALRGRLADGRPAEAVLEHFQALEASAVREPEALAAVLEEAARLDFSEALFTLIPGQALGVAVIGSSGQPLWTDASFRAWFGGEVDDAAARRLLRLAVRAGQASGLLEAVDGAVIAGCAATAHLALRWPLPMEARDLLAADPRRMALLGFAPSRISDLAARAADAFGLTPLESRLAEALLDAPGLEAAADRVGVGRETARDAIRNAQRKTGARRSSDLVRLMLDLMCGDQPEPPDLAEVFIATFGATPAEARAAAYFARGMTARETAQAVGAAESTVRGQLKAVYAKAGVGKAKDFVRLAAEAGVLASMSRTAETVAEIEGLAGRMRIALLPLFALAGAGLAMALLALVAGRSGGIALFTLAGLMIASLAGALTALAVTLSPNPFALSEIVMWLNGALTDRSWREVAIAAPLVALGIAALQLAARPLDALTLGTDAARSLGVDMRALLWLLVLGIGLAVGASVAVAGIIGFVGLIVPHLVRPLTDRLPSSLIVPSALAGACLVLIADSVVRVLPLVSELRLGIALSLIGAPFFLMLLLRMRGEKL